MANASIRNNTFNVACRDSNNNKLKIKRWL